MSDPTVFLYVVFFSALAVLIIYDIYRFIRYGIPGTISHWMYLKGKSDPLYAFLIGVFIGGLVIGLGVHFWESP